MKKNAMRRQDKRLYGARRTMQKKKRTTIQHQQHSEIKHTKSQSTPSGVVAKEGLALGLVRAVFGPDQRLRFSREHRVEGFGRRRRGRVRELRLRAPLRAHGAARLRPTRGRNQGAQRGTLSGVRSMDRSKG